MTLAQRIAVVAAIAVCHGCKAAPKPQHRCPDGWTVHECDVDIECSCGPLPTATGAQLCAPSIKEAIDLLQNGAFNMGPGVVSVKVTNCVDTGRTLDPNATEVEAELESAPPREAKAWGDPQCDECVNAHCNAEAKACAFESVCHCLDLCQRAGTPIDQCGACGTESAAYGPYQTCAAAHCQAACEGAPSCAAMCGP